MKQTKLVTEWGILNLYRATLISALTAALGFLPQAATALSRNLRGVYSIVNCGFQEY
jgi:hypothetical protein